MNMHDNIFRLIIRYSELKKKALADKRQNDLNSIKYLLKKYSPFLEKLKEVDKNEAPHYNLFQVLNIQFLEARVHTPFLTNLLDVQGSHSQGPMFLYQFLKTIFQNNSKLPNSFIKDYFLIKSEFKTSQGVIDIVINYRHPRKEDQFIVIIENKVYAPDQETQILRYYNYATKTLKYNDSQISIVYLKPYKRLPSEYSLPSDVRNKLIEKGVLKLIGYTPEIINWLKECVNDIKSEKLKQSITQYIDNLKDFPYEEVE